MKAAANGSDKNSPAGLLPLATDDMCAAWKWPCHSRGVQECVSTTGFTCANRKHGNEKGLKRQLLLIEARESLTFLRFSRLADTFIHSNLQEETQSTETYVNKMLPYRS